MAPNPPAVLAPSRALDEFEQKVYEISQRLGTHDGEAWDIDTRALNLTFESATLNPPQVSYLLTVAPKHCNMLGNLHGGCAATLFDVLSSMILIGVSKPGLFSYGGVSRHLDVTYIRPVPAGKTVRLTSRVVHVGKRLALIRSEIVRVEDGGVCMVSDHEKANTDADFEGGKL
ncbi:HotDog domain-containing protein [Aspergillus pseudoustus]|uniref:HotDog domain-containing protein n=1 Tax=Aspergillus pseudoustus TaxID=1810923 RepID=A0ABR4IVW0_9EURO